LGLVALPPRRRIGDADACLTREMTKESKDLMEKKDQLRQLLSKTKALIEAMRYSISSSSPTDPWKYASYRSFLRHYRDLAQEAGPLLPVGSRIYVPDLEKIPGAGDTVAMTQKAYFDQAHSNTLLLKSLIEGAIGYAEDEAHKLRDFIGSNLRKAVFTAPEKEADIQNSLESLLVGRGMAKGIDYDRETGRVKTSGKESVPDFVIPSLHLCLEVKLAKTVERLKQIIDEINADIRMYSGLYERQLHIVYDLGTIRDDMEFKRDLEKAPGVEVLIVKH